MRIKNIARSFFAACRGSCNELVAVAFAGVLVLFFALNLAIPDKSFSESENRVLQEVPSASLKDYLNGRLEKKLETYVNDQFVMRDGFIRIKSSFDAAAGGIKSNGVWKGRSGYLIEDAAVPEAGFIRKNAEAIKEFAKRNPKARFRFLLAPNAVSIMKDKLPLGANPADQNVYIDRFFRALEDTDCEGVDVREAFTDGRKDEQLYYYTDHHWTSAGAALAYGEIKKSLGLKTDYDFELLSVKNDFLGTMASKSGFKAGRFDSIELPMRSDGGLNSVYHYTDSKEKTTEFYQLDKLDTKDAYQVFGGTNHSIYTIKTPVKGNRRLLLVKDSYANSVIPYLTQHYTEIVVVDPRYYFDDIQDIMDVEGINDVLFLYNANTFFGDNSLSMMLSEDK